MGRVVGVLGLVLCMACMAMGTWGPVRDRGYFNVAAMGGLALLMVALLVIRGNRNS